MSNQPENEMQPTMNAEEMQQYEAARQNLLAEIEAGTRGMDELTDEELEMVSGGFSFFKFVKSVANVAEEAGQVVGTGLKIGSRFIR